jgi:hypothetical protein
VFRVSRNQPTPWNGLRGPEEAFTDVQPQFSTSMPRASTDTAANTERNVAIAALENTCRQSTGLRCEMVTLYRGGAYHLYRYKIWTDVRLVFAPDARAAQFGGDTDNFVYPRFDLDFTFLHPPGIVLACTLRREDARDDRRYQHGQEGAAKHFELFQGSSHVHARQERFSAVDHVNDQLSCAGAGLPEASAAHIWRMDVRWVKSLEHADEQRDPRRSSERGWYVRDRGHRSYAIAR